MRGSTELPQSWHSFSARVKDLKECSKEHLQTQSMETNPSMCTWETSQQVSDTHGAALFHTGRKAMSYCHTSWQSVQALVKQTRHLGLCAGLSLRRGDVSCHPDMSPPSEGEDLPCFCLHRTGRIHEVVDVYQVHQTFQTSRLTYGCLLVKHLKRNVGPHH